MNALPIPHPVPENPLATEALRPSEWARLLGLSVRAVQKHIATTRVPTQLVSGQGGTANALAFAHLREDWRVRLEALRAERCCRTYADLLTVGERWQPGVEVGEMTEHNRQRALAMRAAMTDYFAALDARKTVAQAEQIAVARWAHEAELRNPSLIAGGHAPLRRRYSIRQIANIRARIEAAGGIALAPLQAYGHTLQVPHIGARSEVPEELLVELRSRATRFGEWNAALRSVLLDWREGRAVEGIGRAASPDEPFPIGAHTLAKYKPSKAARVLGSKGKFPAKAEGWLPAPPLSSAELRLRERIVFDDKRLDLIALDDETGRPCSLVMYLAMDESTRQILGYLLREDGGVRQTDVEGLCAFILRTAGFAGRRAGYATTLKFERGTVAISRDRQELLEAMFPGELVISRTAMIGGRNGPGQYGQEASGNFMGKGKLESFMKTLDHYVRHLPGQRGNIYANQPMMLGDLLLSPERMAAPTFKAKGTMIEEAILCAQTARALAVAAPGADLRQVPGAAQSAQATGCKSPLLYVSEVHRAVQAVIAYYNAERGHRREGFESMRMVQPDGSLRQITESANDKAARLRAVLESQGRELQRISAADTAVLLHKVKRVTVRPGGARVTIGGVSRLYWCPDSLAVAAAQESTLGEKTYLALYNPEDPRELLLLANCPSHVPATASVLPEGEAPTFFEALPLYDAPAANDPAALAQRAAQVARNHSRVAYEHNRNILPFVASETERREHNTELAEPLRAAVAALREEHAAEREPSATGATLVEARQAHESDEMPATRRDAQTGAAAELAALQRAHAPRPAGTADESEPEII